MPNRRKNDSACSSFHIPVSVSGATVPYMWTVSPLLQVWLGACSAPSHYLKQCWHIAICTHRNKLQWYLKKRAFSRTQWYFKKPAFSGTYSHSHDVLCRAVLPAPRSCPQPRVPCRELDDRFSNDCECLVVPHRPLCTETADYNRHSQRRSVTGEKHLHDAQALWGLRSPKMISQRWQNASPWSYGLRRRKPYRSDVIN